MGSKRFGKLFSFLFITIFLTSSLGLTQFIKPVQAATPTLTSKWTRSWGYSTTMMALAADLIPERPGLEIVVVGGPDTITPDGGSVACLDGITGAIIWQKTAANLGISPGVGTDQHCPFEIVDLDKDNRPEIIISTYNGPLVLRGDTGAVVWRNTAVHAGNVYPAVADIDGDGFPEIFVSRGAGFSYGYDYTTELSSTGRIIAETGAWHSCWGGLTIGDTDHDGRFELYQGDRSSDYNPAGDTYTGGGLGVRKYDAQTLELLWNNDFLCSSQCPILADVDKDGIDDVVIAIQTNGGLAVLNSTDGTPLGGRYGGSLPSGVRWTSHSQITVADVDGDGNLEAIVAENSQAIIWDLNTWSYDGQLPIVTREPPKVGDLTGDGIPDIIAVEGTGAGTGYSEGTDLYIYSDVGGDLVQVAHTGGFNYANEFALVADIDQDGQNEIVLSGGTVRAFETGISAPSPQPRTNLQFYGENKAGAATYVEPLSETVATPYAARESPRSGALDVPFNPTLSVEAASYYGHAISVTFSYQNPSHNWVNIATQSHGNGVYTTPTSVFGQYGTSYSWRVTVTDLVTSATSQKEYQFTTGSRDPSEDPPILTLDGETPPNLVAESRNTLDPDGDNVDNVYNWYVGGGGGQSLTGVVLPFNRQPDFTKQTLLQDSFEANFDNWNGNGATSWTRSTAQAHTGSYSAQAPTGANQYLTSDSINTLASTTITVSFWYYDHGVDTNDNFVLRFWNGGTYVTMFNIGDDMNGPEDEWHYFSIDYRTLFAYRLSDFRIQFAHSGLESGENMWIDDVMITAWLSPQMEDYSGNGNNGALSGGSWTPDGVVGGALEFDGSTHLEVSENGNSLGGDGSWDQISVEFWLKSTTTTGTERLLWKHDADDTGTVGYRVDYSRGSSNIQLTWRVYTDVSSYSTGAYSITSGLSNWHHVVMTYSSGPGLKIYVDGVEVRSTGGSGNIIATDGPVDIGYQSGSGDFAGVLDDVRIYNRALSPFQVALRYDDTKDGLSDHSSVAWQEANVGEVWHAEVTPTTRFGDGDTESSATYTIPPRTDPNSPEAQNVEIAPASPKTGDDLTVSYDYYDADGDPEFGTQIRWYQDGVPRTDLNDLVTVPSSETSKDEVWMVTVRPCDGIEFGDPVSSSKTIQNTAPSFSSVMITPDPAVVGNVLTAVASGWYDVDGDGAGYDYQWQIRTGSDTWIDLVGQTGQTLGSGFGTGDYVRVQVTADDGYDLGNTLTATKWIADLSSLPLLVSSLGGDTTDEDLTCYHQNAGATAYVYSWYLNSAPFTSLLLPFNRNSAGTATDYSGYGNNGVVTGASWTSGGVEGGAYSFDGDGDFITVADSSSLGNDGSWSAMTLEYWVYPSSDQSGSIIINKNVDGGDADTSGMYMTGFGTGSSYNPLPDNCISFGVTVGGRYRETNSATDTVIPSGTWSHIVATYESGVGIKIYINGELKSTRTGVSGSIDASEGGDLFIGSGAADGGADSNRYFDGLLDGVTIYNRALSADQAMQRYLDSKDSVIDSSTIVSTETAPNDVWRCLVTPTNAGGDGTPEYTNSLTVLGSGPTHTLTVTTVGDGSVTLDPAGGTYADGTVVGLTAVADPGWTFSGWSGDLTGSVNPETITMDGDKTVTATFTEVAPAAQNAYLVVRGSNDLIYVRLYNATTDSWDNWDSLPSGSTIDRPAAAVCDGELHIVVRGSDGYTLWFSSLNLEDKSFSGWTLLDGATESAPTLTGNGTHLVLAVRGMDNVIYYRVYDCDAESWGAWTGLPGATCDQPAATILGDELHLVVRGYGTGSVSENQTLWYGVVNLADNSFSGWTMLAGATDATPTLAASSTFGEVYLSVKGMDGRIYVNEWTGSWQGWTALASGWTNESPAIAVTDDVLQFVVKDSNGFGLWHCNVDLNTSVQSAWLAITGASPSAPTISS